MADRRLGQRSGIGGRHGGKKRPYEAVALESVKEMQA